MSPELDASQPVAGDAFPDGADILIGDCAGLCRRHLVHVVASRVGPNWRTALSMDLCASCLADFVAGGPMVGGHVYVRGVDGLDHEVAV